MRWINLAGVIGMWQSALSGAQKATFRYGVSGLGCGARLCPRIGLFSVHAGFLKELAQFPKTLVTVRDRSQRAV
jgi:hypothetical protein